MPATPFTQNCPICGRRVHVSHDHRKLTIVCQHCHGAFLAHDPQTRGAGSHDQTDSLMLRADRLLAMLARQTGFVGAA